MKKGIVAILTSSLIFICSVGFASPPVTNLAKGESRLWLDYSNLSVTSPTYNYGSTNYKGFQIQSAVTDKLVLMVAHGEYEKTRYIRGSSGNSWGVGYYLNPYIRLSATNSNYSGVNTSSYGLRAAENVAPKLDAFIGVSRSDGVTGYSTGIICELSPKTCLELAYGYSKNQGVTSKSYSAFWATSSESVKGTGLLTTPPRLGKVDLEVLLCQGKPERKARAKYII